jgi:hypothetical protein
VALLCLSACSSSKSNNNASPTTRASQTTTVTTGVGPTTAATSAATSSECPPLSLVAKTLGETLRVPAATNTNYGVICTYSGGSGAPVRIAYEQDTMSTFASAEASAPGAEKIGGLGDAAYTAPGVIAVLNSGTGLRITAPAATRAQLQALARQVMR